MLVFDDKISKRGDSSLHHIESPQHHNINGEGTINKNSERVTCTKLCNITSQFDIVVLQKWFNTITH